MIEGIVTSTVVLFGLLLLLAATALNAQTGGNILLVVNKNDAVSRQIGEYYRPRRSVPVANVCYLAATTEEEIKWKAYEEQVERPIAGCLTKAGLIDKVLYIVTTSGVPLKVDGPGSGSSCPRWSCDARHADRPSYRSPSPA